MRIFLLGFMGVGKSTLGKMVAKRLELTFLDFDALIEEEMKMTISQIFSEYGELFFRKIEHDMLNEVIQTRTNFIMGTGGGLPCFHNNLARMNEHGYTIYLRSKAPDIAARLSDSGGARPLIHNMSSEQLQTFVEDLLQSRRKFYEEAHLIVDLDLKQSKKHNAKLMLQAMKSFLPSELS